MPKTKTEHQQYTLMPLEIRPKDEKRNGKQRKKSNGTKATIIRVCAWERGGWRGSVLAVRRATEGGIKKMTTSSQLVLWMPLFGVPCEFHPRTFDLSVSLCVCVWRVLNEVYTVCCIHKCVAAKWGDIWITNYKFKTKAAKWAIECRIHTHTNTAAPPPPPPPPKIFAV